MVAMMAAGSNCEIDGTCIDWSSTSDLLLIAFLGFGPILLAAVIVVLLAIIPETKR